MKKLMIIAGVVCAAVFAKGASVDWAVDRNSNDFTKNATVYAFLASDSTGVTTALSGLSSPMTTSAFESALASAGVSYDGGYSKGTGNARGAVDGSLMDNGIADSTDVALMLVVFDAEGKNYTTVDGITGHSFSATTVGDKVAANFSSKFATASWTAVGGGSSGGDVPEPTSGLLLALGGAMLALRRRRA